MTANLSGAPPSQNQLAYRSVSNPAGTMSPTTAPLVSATLLCGP